MHHRLQVQETEGKQTTPMIPMTTPIMSQPHEPAGSGQTPMFRASPKNGSVSAELCEPASSVTGPLRCGCGPFRGGAM